MNGSWKHKGFTLVELLVVTGLIASLLGLVVVIGRPGEKSSIRRSAQDFAGLLLAAQSRALGKPEGAGVMVPPASARTATTASDAVMQPLRAVQVSGTANAWPPDELKALPLKPSVAVKLTPADLSVEKNTFKIRFQTSGGDTISPWFSFSSGPSAGLGTASFRPSAGQTPQNTIWPKGNSDMQASLAQYPSAGTSTLALQKQVAIDLRHSGVGEEPVASHGYGSFEDSGTVAVAYDEVGRLSEIMRKVQETRSATDQPIVAGENVYFLFAAQSDVTQSRSLSSPNSVWVAINPLSGRVTVAENVPQSSEDAAALKAARSKAREGAALK